MVNNEKYTELLRYLQQLGRVVVAFSGGVDSTFLLSPFNKASVASRLRRNVKNKWMVIPQSTSKLRGLSTVRT